MVTKKRGFDIASLVEDNDCDFPRKKLHTSSNIVSFSPALIFSGHPPSTSSLVLPQSHHLLNLGLGSNNNNNNNETFPSAFKKVDKRGINNSPTAQLLDLSFNQSSTSPDEPPASREPVATTSNTGRPGSGTVAAQTLLPFLPPSLAALTFPQTNWCAKCNATFRMTSDLVYHMRSHHKPSSASDPIRKKREEKLRCNICGETFRERHHLTRHMTSHQ